MRRPLPLLIGLHPQGWDSARMRSHFQVVQDSMAAVGYLVLYPDGTRADGLGHHQNPQERYWDATRACCRWGASYVDDVAYLNALIAEAVRDYGADPEGIVIFGLSNGGFMAHRMACDSTYPRAIISMNGGSWYDASMCNAGTGRPSVLHANCYGDPTVRYHGGEFTGWPGRPYPAATAVTHRWAAKSRCNRIASFTPESFATNLGAPTDIQEHLNCEDHNRVVHWAFQSTDHVVSFLLPYFVEHAIVNFAMGGFVRDSDGDGVRDDVDTTPYDSNHH